MRGGGEIVAVEPLALDREEGVAAGERARIDRNAADAVRQAAERAAAHRLDHGLGVPEIAHAATPLKADRTSS